MQQIWMAAAVDGGAAAFLDIVDSTLLDNVFDGNLAEDDGRA